MHSWRGAIFSVLESLEGRMVLWKKAVQYIKYNQNVYHPFSLHVQWLENEVMACLLTNQKLIG